ncbi:MAG: LuxR family transcriptional regulator [Alphaproteobacteria bacterium]|nr:LuxR family transcriptional regulator [Alphaproteobacteria bacterium]MDB5720964.1 LuxR family transcriptional regulator [Alphaproteobacteria bacterium]
MQTQLNRVQHFSEAALAATSLDELDLMMREATSDFGADYYLMIHHTNYFEGRRGLVNLGNYPLEFRQASLQDGRALHDPVMEACEKSLTGFFWSDVASIIPLTARHRERGRKVSEFGLGDGFVVPAHIPGEHLGSCHFAVEKGKLLVREYSAALHTIATFGFEAARRLSRQRDEILMNPPLLTERQRECLILSARGKSDPTIGQLLGLSPKTVNSYLEAAKRRYGVATRAQLIASALYCSAISFQEIVDVRR